MTIDMNALIFALGFSVGMLVGIFIPVITIKIYNMVGASLGDLCEDEEEDKGAGNAH